MEQKLMTSKELCDYLGVTTRTLMRYKREGLPQIKISYRVSRYEFNAVREWMERRNEQFKLVES